MKAFKRILKEAWKRIKFMWFLIILFPFWISSVLIWGTSGVSTSMIKSGFAIKKMTGEISKRSFDEWIRMIGKKFNTNTNNPLLKLFALDKKRKELKRAGLIK